METDYISREAATQAKPEFLNENHEDAEKALYAKGWNACNSAFIDNLLDIPAADVRPVVYGHMIGEEEAEKIFEGNYSDFPYGQCSVCGHCDWDCVESEGFNYCPNCGAKMGGQP